MSDSYKLLVKHCVDVLDTFNPVLHSIYEHVIGHLTEHSLSEADQTFVTEVFSGCVRFSSILNVVMDGFFVRDGKSVLRSEQCLYRVLSYLILFRLDELGMSHFRKFVRSQDVNRTYRFLNFILNEKNLRTWIKDEWNTLYECSFVETTLLSPLFRWLPELQEMLQQMHAKISNKTKPKKVAIASTETKPFNLTRPRPRSVPMPEPIPKLEKYKPVPKAVYSEPRERSIIERVKEENRRGAEERLMEASRRQFQCANPEKSHKTKLKMRTIIQEKESHLEFDRHKANPLPLHVTENIPIKLNTAAILREGQLYSKREEEEIKKLQRLEAGARDASDFMQWQQEMRKQDLDRELADIERRRLEGKLSHEDAILARQDLIQENKIKVSAMKEEAKRVMQQYLEQKLKEEQEMRRLVEDTMAGHKNTKESKRKLKEYKQKIVQDVNAESREMMKQALEQAEEEMRRKVELIQQIRAMESIPVMRHNKLVNFTETAGAGLLSEMSIAELNERLSLLRVQNQQNEEDKRDGILEAKQAKDQLLMDTLETISKHRFEQGKAAALKLEDRKRNRNIRLEVKDDKLSELEQRLEERKAQRKREQDQAKITAKKQEGKARALLRNKKSTESSRWRELESTQERTAKMATDGTYSNQTANKLFGTQKRTTLRPLLS